jgi:hypothetical protein
MTKHFTKIYCKRKTNGKVQNRRYILAQFAMPQDAMEYWNALMKKCSDPGWQELFELVLPQ